MAKLIFAMVVWDYDIEFVDKKMYEKKVALDLTLQNPMVMSIIKKRLE